MEGTTRLAYFYTHGDAVMCPTCSEKVIEKDPGFSVRVVAHYTASRLYLCGACGIQIGPANDEEAEAS